MTASQRAVVARKMHGTGNVFVLLDERPPRFADYAELARTLCAPAGPMDGADGVLVVRDAPAGAAAAAEMRIYNADGGEAEMCGNGVRCVARYLTEGGAADAFGIATLAGSIGVEILQRRPFAARVDVGRVRFPSGAEEETFEALGSTWRFYDVSLGNPHAVVFVDDVAAIDLAALGAAAQRLPRFPAGTNLHVAQIVDAASLRVRHYERGVGLTQACGTGAALDVAWQPGGSAYLSGGAEPLFERMLAL